MSSINASLIFKDVLGKVVVVVVLVVSPARVGIALVVVVAHTNAGEVSSLPSPQSLSPSLAKRVGTLFPLQHVELPSVTPSSSNRPKKPAVGVGRTPIIANVAATRRRRAFVRIFSIGFTVYNGKCSECPIANGKNYVRYVDKLKELLEQ